MLEVFVPKTQTNKVVCRTANKVDKRVCGYQGSVVEVWDFESYGS